MERTNTDKHGQTSTVNKSGQTNTVNESGQTSTVNENLKIFTGKGYTYVFNKNNGFFVRYGNTFAEDPDYSPYGPEILDIEISEICYAGCTFCYKSNLPKGKWMSFETYKKIFDKLPNTVCQIAFGIGSIKGCPDLFEILEYTKEKGVIPNITINGYGLDEETAKHLADVCGGVAVSHYDSDVCFNAVDLLIKSGGKQINIHQLFSMETLDKCKDVLVAYQQDPRLSGLNAIVFLLLKPKGNRNTYSQIRDLKHFKDIISYAYNNKIPFGFDSCSAPHFVASAKQLIKNQDALNAFLAGSEGCESTRFSLYIDVNGNAWPCSFCEDHEDPTIQPVNVLEADDFVKDVWMHEHMVTFRERLINSRDSNKCENCPIFDLNMHCDSSVKGGEK